MKTLNKHLRILTLCVSACPALLPAQAVIYSGADFFRAFGSATATGVLDTTTWSPNSSVEQSLKITYGGTYNTIAFRGVSADQAVVPASVDWSGGDLTFDYMSTAVNSMYRVRLLILVGTTDTTVVDYTGPIALTADGNWHTATVPVSDWAAAYYTAVGNATIDANAPHLLRIALQCAGAIGDINVDNVVVPTSGGGVIVPVGVAVAIAGPDVQLTFDSVAGQTYQLLVSTDNMATWNPVAGEGASGTGDGNPLTLTATGGAPASGSKVFYMVETN